MFCLVKFILSEENPHGRTNRRIPHEKHRLQFRFIEDDRIQQTADYEGTATGFGAVFGTLVFRQTLSETSATSGSLSFVGKALLDDNSIAGGIGHGTWEQIGQEARFKIVMTVKVSDGSQHRSEGIVDHPARTFDGKMYEV